jgi:hypothetical protein
LKCQVKQRKSTRTHVVTAAQKVRYAFRLTQVDRIFVEAAGVGDAIETVRS